MNFLMRFSLIGLAVTLVVAAAMAFALARQLTENEIQQIAAITARHLTTVVSEAVEEPGLAEPWDAGRLDAMDAVLARELPGTGVVRLKLWNLAGTIVYSDDRRLVGQTFDVAHELEHVRSGEVTGELSSLEAEENELEALEHAELLEVYVPVREDGGELVGMLEVYRDTGQLAATISSMEQRVWLGAGIAFLVVYVALFSLARQASRRIIASEKEARTRLEETLLLDRIITAAGASPDPAGAMRAVCRELATAFAVPRCAALWPEGEAGATMAEWRHRPPAPADGDVVVPARARRAHQAGVVPADESEVPAWREALRNAAPVVVEGPGDPRAGTLRERFESNGTGCALFLPLPLGERRGAVMWVEADGPRTWTDAELALARKVAVAADVAIDNAVLLHELRSANEELGAAYESTIEGWARALDLRDRETEGHSRRVTELTMALMREAARSEEELVHARRGALLHDIGKMGIPDTILLKPGPLTDEEWEIMRRHPEYARMMLDPIPHLRPALDIPYGHHEHWDGTGYPQGLRGEDIPFAARVFAIVDVWDALLSDRPYRPAWSEDRVIEYLETLAGSHLDPLVVDLFMKYREGGGRYAARDAEPTATAQTA